MTHTPGPWEIGVPRNMSESFIASDAEGIAIRAKGPRNPEGNAALICAAPDLLAALKALVRRSDNGDTIEPGWYEIEEARAAIAKAEGK